MGAEAQKQREGASHGHFGGEHPRERASREEGPGRVPCMRGTMRRGGGGADVTGAEGTSEKMMQTDGGRINCSQLYILL